MWTFPPYFLPEPLTAPNRHLRTRWATRNSSDWLKKNRWAAGGKTTTQILSITERHLKSQTVSKTNKICCESSYMKQKTNCYTLAVRRGGGLTVVRTRTALLGEMSHEGSKLSSRPTCQHKPETNCCCCQLELPEGSSGLQDTAKLLRLWGDEANINDECWRKEKSPDDTWGQSQTHLQKRSEPVRKRSRNDIASSASC